MGPTAIRDPELAKITGPTSTRFIWRAKQAIRSGWAFSADGQALGRDLRHDAAGHSE